MEQMTKTILTILAFFILIVIILRVRKYMELVKGSEIKIIAGKKDAKTPIKVSSTLLPQTRIGNEFTIDFWVYIRDWAYNFSQPKHIMHIGDEKGNKTSPGIWLYPKDNSLMVRFDTISSPASTIMNPINNPALLNVRNECDLMNVPLQRWNHIAITVVNKTLDIYLNGKLSRSCTLEDVPRVVPGDIYINQFGGFDGDISNISYTNKAIAASKIYDKYYAGFDQESLLAIIKSFIPKIEVDFKYN